MRTPRDPIPFRGKPPQEDVRLTFLPLCRPQWTPLAVEHVNIRATGLGGYNRWSLRHESGAIDLPLMGDGLRDLDLGERRAGRRRGREWEKHVGSHQKVGVLVGGVRAEEEMVGGTSAAAAGRGGGGAREPLDGEGGPLERVGDDEVVEESRVHLPHTVVLLCLHGRSALGIRSRLHFSPAKNKWRWSPCTLR